MFAYILNYSVCVPSKDFTFCYGLGFGNKVHMVTINVLIMEQCAVEYSDGRNATFIHDLGFKRRLENEVKCTERISNLFLAFTTRRVLFIFQSKIINYTESSDTIQRWYANFIVVCRSSATERLLLFDR